jgi:hypothetical protein
MAIVYNSKCSVIIGIVPHDCIDSSENFKVSCHRETMYIVTSKDNPKFTFNCCGWHSHLFPHEEWTFKKV